jgi:MFS family permease
MPVSSLKRAFLRALVVSLCITAGLAIVTLLVGEFDETAGRIVATTAFMSLYSLMALPGGSLLDRGTHALLGWATLAFCGLSFLLAMNLVWAEWEDVDDSAWKLLVVATVLAGAGAQASATTWRRRPDDSEALVRLYWTSLVTGSGLAFMIVNAVLNEVESAGYYRFLGALAVANLLVALLQPIIRRMSPVPRPEPEHDGYRVVFMLGGVPPRSAVEDATQAFVQAGVLVERVEERR